MNTSPNAPGLTDDDIPMEFTLDGLRAIFTDEEIEALNEGDDPILPGVDLTAKRDPEGEADELLLDDEPPAAKTDPEPANPAPVVVDQPDPEPPAPIPVNVTEHRATVDALDTKIADLQEKYDDGELTSIEWRDQLAALVKEQAAAQAALTQAEAIMADMAPKQEAYRQAWFAKVSAYQDQHAYLASPEHYDAWDAALKMVNTNGAYAKLNITQRIEQAHRIYAAHYEGVEGKSLPTKPGLTAAEKKAEAEKPTGPRKDARPEAPMTLANLTNAADNGIEDGRFAQIDRIMDSDPLKAEKMIAALSDADRFEYFNNV